MGKSQIVKKTVDCDRCRRPTEWPPVAYIENVKVLICEDCAELSESDPKKFYRHKWWRPKK